MTDEMNVCSSPDAPDGVHVHDGETYSEDRSLMRCKHCGEFW